MRLFVTAGLFCVSLAGCNRSGSSTSSIVPDEADGMGELRADGTRLMRVSVSKKHTGTSPQTIGIGIHVYNTKLSNHPLYLRALGVNSTRVFAGYLQNQTLQEFIGPRWGENTSGRSVDSRAEMAQAMNSLSADPEATSAKNPIPWDQVRQHIDATGLVELIKAQNSFGVTTHLQFFPPKNFDFSTCDSQTPAYWQERWELYKYYYTFARVIIQAGGNSFEVQNEPDKWPQHRTLETMKLVGTAIQRAASDLKTKDIIVMGPTMATSGGMSSSIKDTLFPELFAQMHTPMAATTEQPGWNNLTAIALHRYSGSAGVFCDLADAFNKYTQASLGARLPLYFTEFQAHTAGSWNGIDTTPDEPAEASRFAAETTAQLSRTEGLYAFILGAYPQPDGTARKNGIHFASTDADTPYLLGGRTRAALSYSLIARNFSGGKRLYRACVGSVCDRGVVSMTHDAKNWIVLVVNDSPQESQVDLDLSALTLNEKTVASVELVSRSSRGGTVERLKLEAAKLVSYRQPSHSTALISVPRGRHPVSSFTVAPTLAVNLRSGEQGDRAGAAAETATVVSASSGSQAITQAYALLFAPGQSLSSGDNKKFVNAFLRVTSMSSDTAPSVVHVYGIPKPQWTPGQLTWNNSGVLMPLAAGTKIQSIADNFVKARGITDLELLGEVAVPGNTPVVHHLLRISDFASRNLESFGVVIVREFRADRYAGSMPYNPRPDDLNESSVVFGGASAAKGNQPELLIEAK
jgi:hypothetical protein